MKPAQDILPFLKEILVKECHNKLKGPPMINQAIIAYHSKCAKYTLDRILLSSRIFLNLD